MAGASGPWFAWAGFGAVVLGVGVLLLPVAYRLGRRWRHLGSLETSAIAGLDPGRVVAIRGTARPVDGTVAARFAGGDALLRRTRIARRRRSSTERGGSRTCFW